MSLFSGLNKLGVGLQTLWAWSKAKVIEGVDNVARKNPMVRIFLDTPIGHPIEQEVEKAYSTACYKKIRSTAIGQWSEKLSRGLGKMIGQTSARILDLTKLNYLLTTGKITLTRYLDEMTKRTLCGAAAIIDKGWAVISPFVKNGLKGLLGFMGMDFLTAEYISQAVNIGITLAKDKIVAFVRSSKTIVVAQKVVCFIAEGVKDTVEGAKAEYKKVVKAVKKVATAAKTKVINLYNGAKRVLGSMADTVGDVVEKLFS